MKRHYVLDIADGNHDLGERPARLIGPFDDFDTLGTWAETHEGTVIGIGWQGVTMPDTSGKLEVLTSEQAEEELAV